MFIGPGKVHRNESATPGVCIHPQFPFDIKNPCVSGNKKHGASVTASSVPTLQVGIGITVGTMAEMKNGRSFCGIVLEKSAVSAGTAIFCICTQPVVRRLFGIGSLGKTTAGGIGGKVITAVIVPGCFPHSKSGIAPEEFGGSCPAVGIFVYSQPVVGGIGLGISTVFAFIFTAGTSIGGGISPLTVIIRIGNMEIIELPHIGKTVECSCVFSCFPQSRKEHPGKNGNDDYPAGAEFLTFISSFFLIIKYL